MASLFVIRGQDHGQQFALSGNSSSIGRDSANTIRLNDSEVSRRHAILNKRGDDQYELCDAGSSNGTFVNSRAIDNVVLRSGDRIQVGKSLLLFTGGLSTGSTRSLNSVEILPSASGDLSQIRGRAESPSGDFSVITGALLESPTPDTSSAADSLLLHNGEILYQVSQAISRTMDIDLLLESILQLIFQWVECDRGCILLMDEVSGEIRPSCSRDRLTSSQPESKRMQISRTILDHVLKQREGVLTSNAQADLRWNQAASIAGLSVNEALCVPMQGRYGLVGAIYVDTEISAGNYAVRNKPLFHDAHLKLMVAIAGQAAMAVEDTQFYHAMLQAERLAIMGQTIANVSHHVKNILQGISGGNYLVESGLTQKDWTVTGRGWDIVKKNQHRISNLVMDMLTFSKDRQPELQLANLNQTIGEVVELMQGRAAEADIRLSTNELTKPIMVMMDAESIHRALLNIVSNAIDAVSSSSRESNPRTVQIQSGVDSTGQRVEISVSDSGDGIASEQLSRIFAPFHSSKGSRGTGLGLPVSQKILREHGGDISVQSQVDQGSRFVLYWPRGCGADGCIHGDDSAGRASQTLLG